MTLFISVLGLSGLVVFGVLGALFHIEREATKALRRPIFMVRQQVAWKYAYCLISDFLVAL